MASLVTLAELLVRSFGLHGEGPITRTDDLRPALERAVRVVRERGQAALVDVVTPAEA